MADSFDNKENFDKCSKPFVNEEVAAEVLHGFFAAVYKLRVELGIANVTLIVQDCLESAPDKQVMMYAHFGETLMAPAMAHWHVGNLERERKEALQRIATDAETGKDQPTS